MRLEPAQPCYFGPGNELFGMHHSTADIARAAVLMCAPLGQDMIRTHRVYRQLADVIAQQGIAVLRFDYFGTGDSAGASVEVDWNRCLADTALAADALRARTGCTRIIGFGARLGGSIALSSADTARFCELLLWDPVLDGNACVDHFDAMQEALRFDKMRFSKPRSALDVEGQWFGFRVSAELHKQIAGWQAERPHVPVRLFDSMAPAIPGNWQRLCAGNENVVSLPPTSDWEALDRMEHAILAPDLIRAVKEHLQAWT